MKRMRRALLECAIVLALVFAFTGCASTGAPESGENQVNAEDAAQATFGPDGGVYP